MTPVLAVRVVNLRLGCRRCAADLLIPGYPDLATVRLFSDAHLAPYTISWEVVTEQVAPEPPPESPQCPDYPTLR